MDQQHKYKDKKSVRYRFTMIREFSYCVSISHIEFLLLLVHLHFSQSVFFLPMSFVFIKGNIQTIIRHEPWAADPPFTFLIYKKNTENGSPSWVGTMLRILYWEAHLWARPAEASWTDSPRYCPPAAHGRTPWPGSSAGGRHSWNNSNSMKYRILPYRTLVILNLDYVRFIHNLKI